MIRKKFRKGSFAIFREFNENLIPFIVSPPELELKQLHSNLKYVFLGEKQTLPVIISADIKAAQGRKVNQGVEEA